MMHPSCFCVLVSVCSRVSSQNLCANLLHVKHFRHATAKHIDLL